MLRVRCLRGGSRGAEAAHLIGAMVGIMVVSFFFLVLLNRLGGKHISTKNKEYMFSATPERLLSLEINLLFYLKRNHGFCNRILNQLIA